MAYNMRSSYSRSMRGGSMRSSTGRGSSMGNRRRPVQWRKANKPFVKHHKRVSDDDKLEMTVVTWNVEGKGSPEEIDKAIMKTPRRRAQIVCLQEANFPAAGEDTEHYKWLCSGTSGSAILISKSSKFESDNFEQVCEQICITDLINKGIKTKVISCYIPPPTHYLSEDIWAKLSELLKNIPSNMMFVIGGDMNAQLGKTDHEKVDNRTTGTHVHQKVCDENGVKLKKLARSAHLRVVNSFSNFVRGCDIFTYKDGEVTTQQDYILVPLLRKGFTGDLFTDWHKGYKHAIFGCGVTIFQDPIADTETEEGKTPKLVISTWDIQGGTPAKVDTLLNDHQLPIVCVQGLFLTSDEDLKTDNYSWHTTNKQWAKNVGIVIKTSPDIVMDKFEPLSDCLCVGDIVFHGKPVKVICCFLPLKSNPQHEAVATQLTDLVKGLPDDTFYFIAGDFNCKFNASDLTKEEVKTSDDNILFLSKLAEETKLCLKDSDKYKYWKRQTSSVVSRLTDTEISNPHQILMPLHLVEKVRVSLFIRWIPFFENSIVSLFIQESDSKANGSSKEKRLYSNPTVTEKEDDPEVKVETVGDFTYKSRAFDYTECASDDEEESVNDISSLLTPEENEKFKSTPPTAEDLQRLLKDFVLFHCETKNSFTFITPTHFIVKSFKANSYGKLIIEDVDILDANSKLKKRMCRIKLQDVVLAELTGELSLRPAYVRKLASNDLIAKLSQYFYTVKAKKSFFNKGQAPILEKDPKLAELLKMVDKKAFPTMEDVQKHIDEFANGEDTDCELIFGKDFSEEFKAIRMYAKTKQLGYRYFSSALSQGRMNHIALFKKQTPQQLRDKLLKEPNNFKYFLIPPCGQGVDFKEFNNKYEEEHMKEENKIVEEFNKDEKKPETKIKTEKPAVKRSATGQGPPSKKEREDNQQRPARGKKRGLSYYERTQGWQRGGGQQRNARQEQRYDDQGGYQYGEPDRGWQMGESDIGGPYNKRQRMNPPSARGNVNLPPVKAPYWRDLETLVIVWPVTVRSQIEERPKQVLEANFQVEFIEGQDNYVATLVTLPLRNRLEKKYCLAVENGFYKSAQVALQLIVKHSTVIKPNPSYLCDGFTPNFIRYKVPCQTHPRTYLIVSKYETGPLSMPVVTEIFETFKNSFNEDIFFDRDTYTFDEKMLLLEEAPKFNLKARHFGESSLVIDRYVCVYKIKSKYDILEEVLKMRGAHPKYTMSTDRLPPRLGLNIF